MLSIGVLRSGQEHYYLAAAAKGIDEYYTVGGEIAGRWVGAGASEFGLGWRVETEELGAVLAGEHPGTGVRLASKTRTVPGLI